MIHPVWNAHCAFYFHWLQPFLIIRDIATFAIELSYLIKSHLKSRASMREKSRTKEWSGKSWFDPIEWIPIVHETFNNGSIHTCIYMCICVHSIVKLVFERAQLSSHTVIYIGSFGYLVSRDERQVKRGRRCTIHIF